ncbi:MAG: hypothetical protein ACRDSH_23980 [Pseudonocardiaceae bacterium]
MRTRLGRQVFELYLLAACALVGLSGIAVPAARARSLVATFPPVAQLGWYVGILLGGVVGIIGITRGGAIGMLMERAALIVLAGMCASFGIASVAFAGPVAFTGSIMLWGFVAPCVARTVQITTDLSAVRQQLQAIAGKQ